MERPTGALSRVQELLLFLLRVAVGWHFLYEGLRKVTDPNWTAAAYLLESRGPLAGFFHALAESPGLLGLTDRLNAWGLSLIGLALLVGVAIRPAALFGCLLLALYYLANPPWVGMASSFPTEGNYLIFDKNLVELLALAVVGVFPSPSWARLGLLLEPLWRRMAHWTRPPEVVGSKPSLSKVIGPGGLDRRELVKAAVAAPLVGGFAFAYLKQRGWESWEEKHLLAAAGTDAVSSATVKTFRFASLQDLKGTMTYGQIGPLKLSRLFLGGNLIGGWAHARDLIYVSDLVKAYHTDEKVFDTLRLAEECGINTILTNPALCRVINAYWRKRGGKIQFISDCAWQGSDLVNGIKISVDGGAHACYVQGGIADSLVAKGKLDEIAQAVEMIRENGLPAGIGAHRLETVQACVEAGIRPDFWVKTLHHCDYWSAKPQEEHDNIWCHNPEATIAYMAQLEEPWIAFKVLAAGAIPPKEGFRFAFANGADFICVGMYDFQIVDDVNLACEILASDLSGRPRPWRA
ncbi:MAG: hypothetical protein Kow00109_10790 [Acidobacteriota bacterium]